MHVWRVKREVLLLFALPTATALFPRYFQFFSIFFNMEEAEET
jgi:hypothetical protein